MDSTLDPIMEERRSRKALRAGLIEGKHPKLGSQSAQTTIVIFSDFQCPYCAQMAKMLIKDVLPHEKEATKLVFRHYPLPGHKWARAAAEAAACAQMQGDDFFWRLHDFIFGNQREFTSENLGEELNREVKQFRGFDTGRFSSCVASRQTRPQVDADIEFGTKNGVNATPTLFVEGEKVASAGSPEQLRTFIRESGRQRVGAPASAQ